VKAKTSQNRNVQQRLEKNSKPLLSRPETNKLWRVKIIKINLSRHLTIHLKLRRFRTKRANRSKLNKQFVVNFGFFGIREISINYKKHIRVGHPYTDAFSRSMDKYSNAVIALGFCGILFYGPAIVGLSRVAPPKVEASQLVPIIAPEVTEVVELPKPQYLSRSIPKKITIPTISVDAGMHEVGLLSNGSIETPNVLSGLVGWYEYGPTPGEIGPSVLVGHVDSYKGPSVFWNLAKLNIGDNINISREDGTVVKFSVTQIKQYPQDDFKTDEVYGDINNAGLRVITCGGTFNHLTGHYSKNTVVFADLVLN